MRLVVFNSFPSDVYSFSKVPHMISKSLVSFQVDQIPDNELTFEQVFWVPPSEFMERVHALLAFSIFISD